MLSRRLIRKLEDLNDDALAYFEKQTDLLRTMPEHCRRPERPLNLTSAIASSLRLVHGRSHPRFPVARLKAAKATLQCKRRAAGAVAPPTVLEYLAGLRRFSS